jgi:hypothetical protein
LLKTTERDFVDAFPTRPDAGGVLLSEQMLERLGTDPSANGSGSLASIAAIRRASSFVSNLAAKRRLAVCWQCT